MSEPTDRLADADERPWEETGSYRMDCVPHRGPLLKLLGTVSLACAASSFCLFAPGLIAVPLGALVAALAERDLKKMNSGAMDPEGREHTVSAWGRALGGLYLSMPAWASPALLRLPSATCGGTCWRIPMTLPTSDQPSSPTAYPSHFHLGVTYQGALLEGSFRIEGAKEARKGPSFGFPTSALGSGHPVGDYDREFIELTSSRSCRGDLVCRFRVRTDEPLVNSWLHVNLETDLGRAHVGFDLEIRPGPAPGGRLLFCHSPFEAYSDIEMHRNLGFLIRELRAQINATDPLPPDLSPFLVVVLNGGALHCLRQAETNHLYQHVESGRRVVVLANFFYHDTVKWANHLTEPFGIVLQNREYGEVLCDRKQIADHPLTSGVQRLRWFRPSPLCVGSRATLLVRNPERADEGFLACAGPRDNLIVVGESLIHGLVCDGWPFQNGRLFANLLGYAGD